LENSEWIATLFSCVSLVVVFWELRQGRKQRTREAQIQLHSGTQSLLLETLHDPELLALIAGNSKTNQKHRRFWQLWLNHIETTYRQRRLFTATHWKATVSDIQEFAAMPDVLAHWQKHQHGYAGDFQAFMNTEILTKKAEAPDTETSA